MAKEFVILSGIGNGDLPNKVAALLTMEISPSDQIHYNNGCRFDRMHDSMRGKNVYIFQSQSGPEADVCAMEAARMIHIAHQASAAMITFIMPSAIYAQSDKKDQPYVPITFKIFVNLIEAQCPNIPFKVVWVDGHSGSMTSVFQRAVTDPLSARYIFVNHIRDQIGTGGLAFISPDGKVNKLQKFTKSLDIPSKEVLYYFDKNRFDNSGKSDIGDINRPITQKKAVIIDDIVNTGGSIKNTVSATIKHGVEEIYIFISHSYHDQSFVDFIENTSQIKAFIITDSVYLCDSLISSKVIQKSLDELFSQYINLIQGGGSISALIKENGK